MKITSIVKNDFGQIIVEVIDCNSTKRIPVAAKADIPKVIAKACCCTDKEDVIMDLQQNFPEFYQPPVW